MASEPTVTTLGEISEDVAYGYTESASEKEVGPHFLRITDIQNGVVNWSTVPFCPISESDHQKYRLQAGDIVVARTGNSTGENFLFRGGADSVFASYLIRFRIDQRRADPAYVWYNLRTKRWWNYVHGSKTGSAQAGANAKVLGRFELQLPPLSEQKAIARILGTLDDKIELNRRMNATLEAMARALFQSWFVDFDPVHILAGNKPEKPPFLSAEALAKAGFPDSFHSSELGEIPNGWKIEPLENLAAIRGGKQLPTADCRSTGTFPVFGANGIMGYTEEATHPSFVIAFGRVGAYCGSIHWSLDGAWINNNASAVVPIRANEYVLQAMLGIDFHSMRTGSAQPFIPNSALASAKVVYPGHEISDAFARIIAPLRRLQADNDAQSRTLATLRDTLLPKLLSGDLPPAWPQN